MADLIGLHDASRIVLRMAGADAREVLQGVVTNDVDRVTPGRPVYAALLTPQGKYLSDFMLLDGGNGDVLIDVARDQAAGLAQKLKMYGLRRDAALSVEEGCEIAFVWVPGGGGDRDAPDAGDGGTVVAIFVWLVIAGLRFGSRTDSDTSAPAPSTPSSDVRRAEDIMRRLKLDPPDSAIRGNTPLDDPIDFSSPNPDSTSIGGETARPIITSDGEFKFE